MDIPASNKPLGAGPKTRVCYICGRQYSLHSFEIHIPQCKALWIAREEQKDPKERRKLPEDPLERLQGGGGGGGGFDNSLTGPSSASPGVASPGGGGFQMSRKELDELNKMASDAYNNETLETCAFCGRTFLPEKLVIHNRSCTAENPARRVTDKVRKGNELPSITENSTPSRPKTTTSLNPRNRSAAPTPTKESLRGSEGKEEEDDTPNLRVSDGALVGHLGGAAGRGIRTKPTNSRSNPSSALSPTPTNIDAELADKSKEEVVSLLSNRIDFMESTIFDLSQSIGEMKVMLSKLKDL